MEYSTEVSLRYCIDTSILARLLASSTNASTKDVKSGIEMTLRGYNTAEVCRTGLPMLANSQRWGMRMGVRMRELQIIANWYDLRITTQSASAAQRCAGELLIRRSEQLAAKWGANVRIQMVCELVRIANYQHR